MEACDRNAGCPSTKSRFRNARRHLFRGILLLGAFLLTGLVAPAEAEVFVDDFNRPDGPVGNGWTDAADNVSLGGASFGGTLVIANGRLTNPIGRGSIYRPFDISRGVTVSATYTQGNGEGGALKRYEHEINIGSTGAVYYSGYGIGIGRSDERYNNSAVYLHLNEVTIGTLPSTFQYGSSIDVSVTFAQNGSVYGTVTGDGNTFAFNFGPRAECLPGTNVLIELGGADTRAATLTYPTLDNLRIESPQALVPVTGSTQSVNEGAHVTLDGSVCLGQNLSYAWTQVGGPSVSLVAANTANPSFVAPTLPGGFGSQTLSFQLTVTDGASSSSAVANVIVVNVNQAPVSDAGASVLVQEGSPVTLNGGNSYDPDGDLVTYGWTQISGPTVTLSSVNSAVTSFVAPLIGGAPNNSVDLIFALTTSDGALSNSSAVTVTVQRVNHPPVADAGTGQTVRSGATVAFNGSRSSDPDSDPLQFMWTQLSGPAVSLTGASTSTPSFTAPNVSAPTTLVFRLVVFDGLAASLPSDVAVTVTNNTPVCSAATASPSMLWPPNHALVPIKIVGVTDPDNDQLSLSITGVTQDEPVNGTGDGDTSPDAVIQGSGLLLRAERSGTGDGRVYFISFAAADNLGGSCTGAVQVTVPKNMSKSGAAVDSGTRYQSTAP